MVRSSITQEDLGVEPLLIHVEMTELRWLCFGCPWMPPYGGFSRHVPLGGGPKVDPEDTGQTMSQAWYCLRILPEDLVEVSAEREIWASLLRLLPLRPISE